MAEALVSVLLERLAMLSIEKIERELKMVSEVKQEFENLTLKLEAIQAVLEDAEQRREMEAGVKLWLNELNDVSFDIDNVLDEWITRVLKHQMEVDQKKKKHQMEKQEKPSAEALVTTKKKVCFPCHPSSCFRFGRVNPPIPQLLFRHEIAGKIKDLNVRLALIDQNKQSFSFQTITRAVPELPQRSKTTSLPNVKTFGRGKEKNHIVSKLISESSQEKEVPLIIPIVGMGGMGKTTLSQLVYNDENVKSHFDRRIWVCVSDPFEEIKISQAIIEELDKHNTSKYSTVLQALMSCIADLIKGKKFLLVLDDVWNPKSSQWEELIKPLQNGAMGSRILVTTRNEKVATLMKATSQIIPMKELGDTFCLSLFYYNADIDESSVPEEFKDIGLELVKRCKGLPLAAKTLGSLMRNKKTIREWETVLKSKTWELKEIQEDVFRPLLLSYHDLTPPTKRCILYCAIFPKDYVYDMNTLIEMWMSQDYLNVKESKDKIIVGQNIFDDLVMRSFFQDFEKCESYGAIRCKIHDIVHDFLQYLTEQVILNVEFDASERKEQPSDKILHLTLVEGSDSLVSLDSFLCKCKKLRTLTVLKFDFTGSILTELMVKLKCLRTITLSGKMWKSSLVKIPTTIGGLIHLRYLDLSNNTELKELPSTMGSLYNLQTLRLVKCKSLEKLDVGSLINLRHLYVDGCDSPSLIGIEKLTNLQRLDVFHVCVAVGDTENKLEHLKDLNQLRGSLKIEILASPDMAENAGIMLNKSHLLELRLSFFHSIRDEVVQREIMNGLEPHRGLESLRITSYRGVAFSDWLSSSLHRLTALILDECPNCKYLPPLGKLASLESLYIQNLDRVSKVGVEFLGIREQAARLWSSSSAFISFPKLKNLTFKYMESWEEWEGVEEDNSDKKNNTTIMPCLFELKIELCQELKALPDFLWNTPLQKLLIDGFPILKNLYRKKCGEQWTKISHIQNINVGL